MTDAPYRQAVFVIAAGGEKYRSRPISRDGQPRIQLHLEFRGRLGKRPVAAPPKRPCKASKAIEGGLTIGSYRCLARMYSVIEQETTEKTEIASHELSGGGRDWWFGAPLLRSLCWLLFDSDTYGFGVVFEGQFRCFCRNSNVPSPLMLWPP